MRITGDRPFDWVAALAVASGAAVLAPSIAALVAALISLVVQII